MQHLYCGLCNPRVQGIDDDHVVVGAQSVDLFMADAHQSAH